MLMVNFRLCHFCILLKILAQSPPGHYERLLNNLFNGYDKRVRPFSSANKPVAISETILGCILIQIVRLNSDQWRS